MLDALVAVQDWVVSLAGTPWILLAVATLALIDGVFPPMPSETVVIAVAALSLAGGGPSPWLLVVVAAAGALCGDLLAYTVGARLPLDRVRALTTGKGQAVLARASSALARRGAPLIVSARFVPGGRVAVNATAGATAYPLRKFAAVDALAAVLWAGFSTALGLGAGAVLGDRPLLAAGVGVTVGIVVGLLVEKLAAAAARRRSARLASSGGATSPAGAASSDGTTSPAGAASSGGATSPAGAASSDGSAAGRTAGSAPPARIAAALVGAPTAPPAAWPAPRSGPRDR